jgi:hypothetical protein
MKIIIFGFIGIIGVIFAIGYFLPSERTASRKAIIKAPPEVVFSKVTNIADQEWRSTVGEVEVTDLTQGQEVWIEKPKKGPPIKFRTKVKNPVSRFEIEIIDNPNFGGHWVGTFNPVSKGETEVEFTEKVIVTGIIPKIMSHIFFNVDQSVEIYINDLKKATE